MPIESYHSVAEVRPRRRYARKFALSFGATLIVLATAGAAVLHRAGRALTGCTASYSLTSTGVTHDWKTAPWSPTPPAGTWPGQATGDCVLIGGGVQVSLQNSTISLQDFTINTGTSGPSTLVTFGTGAAVTETGGSFTNGGTLKLDSGGSATFNTGSSQAFGGTVNVNGGTLTLNDFITLFGQLQLKGGTLNGSGTLDVNGGTLTFDGSQGPMSVAITNPINVRSFGTANYTSTIGGHTLSLSTPINIQSSSTFFANADESIDGSGSGKITLVTDTTGSQASGQLSRGVGAGDITINVPVDNNGTVAVTGTSGVGGIVLAGGGSHTGTFNSSLSKISFSGTHDFNNGSNLSTPTRIFGASTIVNVTTTSGLSTNGMVWEGGTINGPGKINVTGASTFDTSATSLQLNGEIQNKGDIQIEPGNNFNMGSSSLLESSTTQGELELLGDVVIPASAGVIRIDSGAYMEAEDPTTSGANVGSFLDLNGGNLYINSSKPLTLSGGGQATATSYIQLGTFGGKIVNFTGGTFTLNNPVPIGTTLPGSIWIDGGIVNFAAATTTINDNFDLRSGEFYGPDITLNRGMTWAGGEIGCNFGHTTVHIPTPQIVDSSTLVNPPTLHDATLDLNGTFNLNPSANSLTLENSSTISINAGATMDLQGDGNILSGAGVNTVANTNLLKKSGGSSGTRFDTIVTNSSTISSESASGGTIIFNGGGSMSAGSLSTSLATNTIDVAGGVFIMSGGQIIGPGPTRTTITGELDVAPSITIPANAFEMVNGTLGGPGEMQITKFKWHGGTMNGGGTTTLFAGTSTLDGSNAAMVLTNRTLQTSSNATVNYNATNALDIRSGGVFTNLSGTIDLQNNAPINATIAGGSLSNSPSQMMKKSNAGTTVINVGITNGGTIFGEVDNAVIQLANSGAQSINGTIDMIGGTGAALQFANGTFTIPAVTVIGPGAVMLMSGALNITGDNTFPHFVMNAGTTTVSSPKTLTVGQFDFNGGVLSGGGTTNVNGTGMNVGNTAPTLVTGGHALALNAATTYNASTTNFLTIDPSSSMTNFSTFNANVASRIGGSSGLIHNNGTFAVGAVTVQIDPAFNLIGSLSIQPSGILKLTGGGSSTGTITNGGFLEFGGGTYSLNPGTSTSPGGTIKVTAGTVNSSINLTVPNFGLLNGTYTGTGNLTFTNAIWSGGTLSGSGTVTESGGGSLTIDGAQGAMTLDTRAFTNNGTINYSPAVNALSLTNGASFINALGATFDVKSDQPINGGSISNAGTFKKTAGSGSPTLPSMTNSGLVTAQIGTMTFPAFTQTAGATNLIGGNIAVTPGTMQLNGGSLTGGGTINASVSNGGAAISPGGPTNPGTINISGGYSHSAGSLNVRMAGTANFDQLLVGGVANLTGGTFNASLINGFVPTNGNTFDVFTFASKTGTDFTSKTLPTFAGGGTFTATYLPAGTPTKLQLQAVAIQADVNVSQTTGGTILHNQNTTWTVTINNAGTSNATNVQLSNSITNGTLVSATPSQGSCVGSNCTIGALAAGNNATVTLVINPSGAAGSTLQNVATVTNPEADPNTANNTSTASMLINAASDLSVTNNDSPDPVNAGANVTYTVAVKNNGPDPSTGSTLDLTLTGGGTFVSVTGATCTSPTASTRQCTIGGLAVSGTTTVTAVVQAPASAGTMSLNAVSTYSGDTNNANNGASQSTTINAVTDLAVVKTGPSSAVPGSTISYTVTITNNGPSTVSAYTVSDPTPSNLTFVSNAGACTTTYPCSMGTLASGQSVTITSTYTVALSATGSTTNTATATVATDPNTANNASSVTTAFGSLSDVTVVKTGPANATSGTSISYTIQVKNLGGVPANGVTLTDPTPSRLTLTSVAGFCSALPCNIGTLNGGQTVTIFTTYDISAAGPGTTTNTATVSSTTTDSNPANNQSSVTTIIDCPSAAPQLNFPAANATNVPTSGSLVWTGNGSANYIVHLAVAGVGCTTQNSVGQTQANQLSYSNLLPNTDYDWRIEGTTPSCNINTVSACGHFRTGSNCTVAPPALIAPINGATVSSPVHFSWTAITGVTQYELFVATNGGAASSMGTFSNNFADVSVVDGPGSWFVVANVPSCGTVQSATGNFNGCNTGIAPVVSVVADATSGQSFAVSWDAVPGATKYEIDEASNAAFTNATTTPITPASNATQISVNFTKVVQQSAQPFFYRVHAFSACGQVFGPYSTTVRIVILPPPASTDKNPNINVPAGSTTKVTQQIFVPGQPTGSFNFTANVDEPWISVSPQSGLLPPSGVTLTLTTDPSNLPNGTFTATVIVSITPIGLSGRATPSVTTVVNIPVSISLVTPVTPTTNGNLPAGALVIPSVGHLDGIDSHWQSDIRVTNAGTSKLSYSLTFTPDDPAKGTKNTTITIDAGKTTALDDIVRNWYGIGQLGESANGVLEIHPITSGGAHSAQTTPSQSLATVASSRTYNVTTTGTLGQYVPAVPFANFIGKAAPNQLGQILSLQQVAQSAAYRTNFGLVEANGKSAEVVMSVFDNGGVKLKDIPVTINAFQQIQLNSMLASNGITNLGDGRVEVKVASGDGKVTTYASVVDNFTNDPLLVSGVTLGQISSSKFVLPGVAALNNGNANWRTDMRVFNPSTSAQNATLTFYPLGNAGPSIAKSMSIGAGQVTALDDVVQTLFGQANAGGAVHVTTPTDSNLVVTGRTYDKTAKGTFGQFIPAVTPAEALGLGGRALQILQVEDSSRYRTNIGIAEVTGKPVTVEIAAILPDSRVTPSIQMTLGANEYRQDAIIQEMGLGNAYNTRITVRVVSGEGKVMAYGSVIDMSTQDPTYVPAQ